jgi:plasmid stability protein
MPERCPRDAGSLVEPEALEVPDRILYDILMQDAMERINLNVPGDVRKRLRAMAKRAGRTEAEVARTLLVSALTREEREEMYRRFAESFTPEMRARTLAMLKAFERLDG